MSKKLTEQERTINRQNAACNLVAKEALNKSLLQGTLPSNFLNCLILGNYLKSLLKMP